MSGSWVVRVVASLWRDGRRGISLVSSEKGRGIGRNSSCWLAVVGGSSCAKEEEPTDPSPTVRTDKGGTKLTSLTFHHLPSSQGNVWIVSLPPKNLAAPYASKHLALYVPRKPQHTTKQPFALLASCLKSAMTYQHSRITFVVYGIAGVIDLKIADGSHSRHLVFPGLYHSANCR